MTEVTIVHAPESVEADSAPGSEWPIRLRLDGWAFLLTYEKASHLLAVLGHHMAMVDESELTAIRHLLGPVLGLAPDVVAEVCGDPAPADPPTLTIVPPLDQAGSDG